MAIPVKPINEIEEKSEVSINDKILILDSVSEEARLASKDELKGDKGDKWDTGEKWDKGDKWDKWDKGNKGDTWPQGNQWEKGETWPKWDKGDTWEQWPQGIQWPKWDKWDKWDKGERWYTWPQGEQGIQGIQWPQWEQGIQGIQWPVGDAFAVYKTYNSIAAMEADKSNVPEWKFVMITSDVEDPDNAKLYAKWESDFTFVTDMSWATGMKWDTGEQGIQWPTGNWISSVTTSKSWKTTTVTMNYTSWEPTVFQVQDWADWQGSGDMSASTYDPTGKMADAFDYTNMYNTPTAWQNIDISNNKISTKWIEVNVATAYWTAAKVWTTTAGNYTPTAWDFLLVNFVNGCSVASPTLNIDWSGAKAIRTGNAAATTSTFALWTTANSNIKALLYYDWTYYRCWSTTDSNTTYSTMGVSEWQAGTATNQRSMRADYLKQIIKYHAVDNSRLSDDWYNGTTIAPSQASIYYEFAKRELQAWTDLEIVPNSSHNLPEWYTELSFLWWSGSWYINTWNILQCKDTIKIKFKRPTATAPSSTQSFFGSLQGSNNVPRSAFWFRTNWYVFWWANQTVDFAPIDANIHTIEVWYDWVDYYYKYDNWAKTTYTPTATTDPSINAYLFARNWSSVTYSWWIRIYYLEWAREDWTDVAHLIPAQRDSDWVLWMYDLVNETFLAPAWSGTWSWEPLGNVINFTNDSGYITSESLPTKTSDLTNDSWFITSSALPTKTSDLTNDSGFITSSALPTKVSDLTNDSWFITSSALPTKTSDLTNDSGFITSSYHDSTKQDTISDLSSIRNNATAWAWAATTISWYGNIVTHNTSEFLTAETVVSGDSWVTYTIKKSTTAPSWAGSNTITLVIE